MLLLHHEAKIWWPARVTRPVQRIKSPLHHFNACRPKLVLTAGFAPALATFSTSCLCIGLREQRNWSLQPVMLRQNLFTKQIHRLLHGGKKWSQSPVLPRTWRAYETCLSAGSTAKMEPHLELDQAAWLPSRCIANNAFGASKNGRRETTCTSKAAWF
jgi:hypothetical protein